jgi:hypothetical protein
MLRTILRHGLAMSSFPPACQLFVGQAFRHAVCSALDATGRWEKRTRSLPAHTMLTFLVALALFRQFSIPDVYRHVYCLARRGRRRPARHATNEALLRGKARLGTDAPAVLFQTLADQVNVQQTFHGFAVHAVDGLRLGMPDTAENEARFGRWTSSNGDRTAFPQLLAVALIATETRHVRKVEFVKCTASERESSLPLLEGLGASDLVLMDRGFHAVWYFQELLQRSIHFLCRASGSYKPRILQRLGHGDYLVEASARIPQPCGSSTKVTLVLRMIEYKIGRRRRVRLLTDLVDSRAYRAIELARLYRERWECELANDEIKTHLATPAKGTAQLPFRSKTPDAVLQEAYGLFTAYNLLRSWIAVAASASGVRPREISFVGALHLIQIAYAALHSMPGVPVDLIDEIARLRTHRIRRPRRYPRVVRIKIVRFPRKRKWHQQVRIDYSRQIRLVNHYSKRSGVA